MWVAAHCWMACERYASIVFCPICPVSNVCLYLCVFFSEVWRALLKEMPLHSLLRCLGKMTSNKILEQGSADTQAVCDRIQNEATLKKVRDLSY